MIASCLAPWCKPARNASRLRRLAAGLAALAVAAVQFGVGPFKPPVASATALSVSVSGNHLVDTSGSPIRLIGVNHSGSEFACVDGEGILVPSDSDTPAMIGAMKSWNINSVRLALNEDCWLGINLPYPQFGGTAYRSAVLNYVTDLNAAGLYVILDLHWNAPGTETARSGQTMADEDHAPAFWASVATAFKGHQGVLFDLYNEPRYLKWSCLVNGGCVVHGLAVAGYNQLISTVRSTGATNVVMVAGTAFAANPTGFRKLMPTDPIGQLAISVHVYNFNAAKSAASWAKWVHIGLLKKAPVVTGELGEKDCTPSFINAYMPWADTNGVSYLAFDFNTGACNAPSLISDYSGTPTPYGAGYKVHLAGL